MLSALPIVIVYMTFLDSLSSRKIFQWISYYFFFYNAFVGLLSAIYRLLMATVLNLMLLIRVDRAVLPALQSLDTGILIVIIE